jgi:hypothetical protein
MIGLTSVHKMTGGKRLEVAQDIENHFFHFSPLVSASSVIFPVGNTQSKQKKQRNATQRNATKHNITYVDCKATGDFLLHACIIESCSILKFIEFLYKRRKSTRCVCIELN